MNVAMKCMNKRIAMVTYVMNVTIQLDRFIVHPKESFYCN